MSKKSILIVDDAIFMRIILKKLFELDGRCDVIGEATNGNEAIEKASALQPDIITMDIVMPDLNGLEAVKIIREKSPNTKVVMMTSVSNHQMIDKALEAGAYDYLPKPIDDKDVKVLLDKIFDS
ncbi:MAG: response regulator [Ignavibacteriales bacterium]